MNKKLEKNQDLEVLKSKLVDKHGKETLDAALKIARLERDFLDCISLFRKRMKVTQKELAEEINSKSQQISKYERSEQMPTLTAILKICDALGLELILKSKKDDEVLFRS